jgi:hypothetical protein
MSADLLAGEVLSIVLTVVLLGSLAMSARTIPP